VAARTVLNRRAMRFNATHATGVVFVIVWLIPGFQHSQSPHDGVRRFLALLLGKASWS